MALKFMFNSNKTMNVLDENNNIVKTRKEYAANINGIDYQLRNGMTPGVIFGIKKMVSDLKHKDLCLVGKGIVLNVKFEGGEWVISGETYNTAIDQSPLWTAMAKANGDLKAEGCPSIQLKRWDEDAKKLVNDRVVVCNSRECSNGILYKETDIISSVSFVRINKTLKKYYKKNKKDFKAVQKQILNKIFTLGLHVSEDGTVSCVENPVGGTVYNVISWSASSERNEVAMFTSMDTVKAYKILNRVLGGALKAAVERPRTVQELKKFAKRIGNLSSACLKTATVGNKNFGIVIYTKSVEGPEDYDDANKAKLAAAGVKIERNTYDGSTVYSASFIRAMFAALGIKISLAYAGLLALQTRLDTILTKVFGEGKTQKNIQFRKDVLVSMVSEDKILRAKAGEDVSHLGDKKVTDYSLIIIGNEDNIGMIVDIDAAKALKDISLQDVVDGGYMNYLLDIARCSDTNTSGQMIQKFLAADKEATKTAIKALLDEQFANRLSEYFHGDLDTKNCSLARFILRHVKDENGEVVRNSEALRTLINSEIKTLEAQFKKYRVNLKAVFLRALFDDAYFLTKGKIDGVLSVSKYTGKLEAYSYDVELKYKDQIDAIYANDSIINKEEALDKLLTGVVFKYPSPASNESATMTFKTSKVLIERIAYMEQLSKEEREILIDDFVNTSFGVIKMAPNNLIKHRLAGMDTDFDGVAVVFEKTFVDIMLEASKKAGHDGLTIIKDI